MPNFSLNQDKWPEKEGGETPEVPIPERKEKERAPEKKTEETQEEPRPTEEQKPSGGPPPQMPSDEEEEMKKEETEPAPPPPDEVQVVANIKKELARPIPENSPKEEEAANKTEEQKNRDILGQP